MPKVLNYHIHGLPKGAVFIGRPSKWSNPFKIGPDGTREQVLVKYEAYLKADRNLMRALCELRGKDLVCYCVPRACHGDILLELANAGSGCGPV